MVFVQFLLLALGLAALAVSTRQFTLVIRLMCWLGGFILFVVAAALALMSNPDRVGIFTILGEASSPGPSGKSVLDQALSGSWLTGAIAPLFDIFIVFGAILAIGAAIALTPGDKLDKAMRPVIAGTIGAMVGGFIALALVASGLSGTPVERTYISRGVTDVIDGDTIRIGDVSMRLAYIDAPEFFAGEVSGWSQFNQWCRRDGGMMPCGQESRTHLADLVQGNIVVCRPVQNPHPSQAREAFGRPIVSCEVRKKDEPAFDLATKMAADGHADVARDNNGVPILPCADPVRQAAIAAQSASPGHPALGMWRGPTLTPYVWRNNDDLRRRFVDRANTQIPPVSLRC